MKTRYGRKRKYCLWLFPISALCLLLVRMNPKIAEYIFARGIYRFLSQIGSRISGLFPFSISECFIIILLFLLPILFGIWLYRMHKLKRTFRQILYSLALSTGAFLGIITFLFVILCGTNYYRYSFITYCDFKVEKSTTEELYQLCLSLAEEAKEARQIIAAEEETYTFQKSFHTYAKEAQKLYEEAGKSYPVLAGKYGIAKEVFFSHVMSYTKIVGIFVPFTLEANVNTDVPDYSILASMCHEMAHMRGFMKEEEANYIAYLVCTQSDQPEFRYSGYMSGLEYALQALQEENAELAGKVYEQLTEGILRDMSENYEYWHKIEENETGQVAETVSREVNDTYLKANGQTDGIESYGLMLDWLLAEFRQR